MKVRSRSFSVKEGVVSLLNTNILSAVGASAEAALEAAGLRKHSTNDTKCAELKWICIPLVVESYGAWGREAQQFISSWAFKLYSRLNIALVRANARAILYRT